MDSAVPKTQHSNLFKGIALFTPGGDLVYCIDPDKQRRWHLQLCSVLQEMLGLTEPPHFLVPCYTATIDRWLDPQTQQLQTAAEACPLVLKHQAILNAVFEMSDLVWRIASRSGELCNPVLLESYRQQFPQLWEDHDLVVRCERTEFYPQQLPGSDRPSLSWSPVSRQQETQGYVLRLFISGRSAATETILQSLHQLLEKSLQQPYTLKVIDIYKHPDLAEVDQITATPTLVKVWPQPARKIVGDLSNMDKILQMLALS